MAGRWMGKAAAIAGCVLTLGAAPAGAHPHEFIDGGVDFIVEDGRLTAIRLTWHYDEFTSLYILAETGVSPSGEMSAEDRAALIDSQIHWAEGWDGDSYLRLEGNLLALGGPQNADVTFEDGRVKTVLDRAVIGAPAVAGERFEARLYDPGYYVAYTVTKSPEVIGADCGAEVQPFEMTPEKEDLLEELMFLGPDEQPEVQAGALLSDLVVMTCD